MKKQFVFISVALVILLTACSHAPAKPAGSSGTQSQIDASSSSSDMMGSSSSAKAASSVASVSAIAVKVHESSDTKVIKLYNEAAKYYQNKDYTSAVKDCDAAIAIDPLCYEALNIKGAALYYATGDPQQGLPLINRCIQLNPNYQYGYFDKALIYKGKKDWDTSIGLFNKVIQLAPDNAWAYYGISTIYADRNMVPQSLQYLKKAIEVDPSVKETARVQSHYDRMRSNKDFEALVK